MTHYNTYNYADTGDFRDPDYDEDYASALGAPSSGAELRQARLQRGYSAALEASAILTAHEVTTPYGGSETTY